MSDSATQQRGEAEDIPVPPNIRWLVALVGVDATLRLLECHAGTRVYVPEKATAKNALWRTTQLDAKVLAPLIGARGGQIILLPLCREWRARVYRHRDHASYAQIARKLGVVESTVFRILDNSGMTNQLRLPL